MELDIDNQNQEKNLNLNHAKVVKKWFMYYKLNRKLILYSLIFGVLLGLFIALLEKPTYKAVLTFAMEEDKGAGGGIGGALGLASSLGIDLGSNIAGGGGAFSANNLSVLMKSRLIVEKVLLDSYIINDRKTTLADYYLEVSNLKTKWKDDLRLKDIKFPINSNREKFTLVQDSILFVLHKKLTKQGNLDILQKDKKVTIVTIEVNSKNEIFSKIFCEALANETSKFYIQTKSKKARNNTDLLQKQTDSVKSSLFKNISGVAKESDNIFNLNPSYNTKGVNSKKFQVDVTANTEILKQLVVQLELSKVTLRKETPLIQLIDSPRLPLEKDQDEYFLIIYPILGSIYSSILMIIFLFFKIYFIKLKESFKNTQIV